MKRKWIKNHKKINITEEEIVFLIDKFSKIDISISLDFDSVLWDWHKNINIFLIENNIKELNSLDITHWDYIIENHPNAKITWESWEHYIKSGPIQSSIEFVKILKRIFNGKIQIVTASHNNLIENKDKMIQEIYNIENIIHTSTKSIYTKNSILIDDAIHNINSHTKTNIKDYGILFDLNGNYGWNKENIENNNFKISRITNYEDIFKYLKKFRKLN